MIARLTSGIISLLMLGSVAVGQAEWETKPFEKWEKADVESILNESAWAKSFTKTWNVGRLVGGDFTAVVTLRSALPIRMALLRKLQIETEYDAMNQAEKESFDRENMAIYTCPACKTHFIVSVFSKEIFLASSLIESKKKFVTLSNDKGASIEVTQFAVRKHPDQTEYIFFFPRPAAPDRFLREGVESFTFKLDFRPDDLRGLPFREATFSRESISRDGIAIF